MDALCKRFNIDNSKREKHSALIDCKLLKEIYINLLDLKEPRLNLQNTKIIDFELGSGFGKANNKKRKIIKPTSDEAELHQSYLKSNLSKNYF